jgi:hypothetical protein
MAAGEATASSPACGTMMSLRRGPTPLSPPAAPTRAARAAMDGAAGDFAFAFAFALAFALALTLADRGGAADLRLVDLRLAAMVAIPFEVTTTLPYGGSQGKPMVGLT